MRCEGALRAYHIEHSGLSTYRVNSGPQYSFLQPRICWSVLHISSQLSAACRGASLLQIRSMHHQAIHPPLPLMEDPQDHNYLIILDEAPNNPPLPITTSPLPLPHPSSPCSSPPPRADDSGPFGISPAPPPSPALLSQPSAALLSQSTSFRFLPSLSTPWPDTSIAELDHRCLHTLKGDSSAHISSLTVVGDYLYAGASSSTSPNNGIRVWQKLTMKECGGFGRGYGAAKALVVAGDLILSAHQDLKIRVWSRSLANRRRPRQVAEGDSDLRVGVLQEVQALDSIANSHKLLASMPTVKDYIKTFIPSRNYVQVRRHHKRLWIEHVDNISMLAVGGIESDPVLYSASWDRTIKVWNLSEFKCIESFRAHDDAINALLVAQDGVLYSASADAKVKVWGKPGMVRGGQKHSLVACLEAHKLAVNALALSQDREGSHRVLYSAGCDRGIVVWERGETLQHMVATGVLRGHRQAILCLVSTDSVLCSGSADHTIRVWRRTLHDRREMAGGLAHSCVAVLQGHSGPVKCLSLVYEAAGNHLLYSSSLDQDIKVWQVCGCVNEAEEEKMAFTQQKSVDSKSHQIWKFHSV